MTAWLREALLAERDFDAEQRRASWQSTGAASTAPAITLGGSSGWRQWAACRSIDTAMFFPTKGDVWLTRAAVAVCSTCGVRDRCLESALLEEADASAVEVSGIRGGRTPAERVRLARRRAAS